jgi:hypothetical protein
MPITLAHPTTSPTVDRPAIGEVLRGGGTAMGGTDQLGLPNANFVWTGTMWVPMSAAADGSINVNTSIADVLSEYSAAAALTVLRGLLFEMGDGVASSDAVAAELRKLTAKGSVGQAHQVMPARQATVAGQPVTDISTQQGMKIVHDVAQVAFDANRKYVAVDAGAYTSPITAAAATDTTSTVTFTGVNLLGRSYLLFNATDRMYHTILAAVDPAGGAVGTLTITPAIPSANAVLRIPFTSVPWAINTAADAMQTLAVVGDPPRINGSATFVSTHAAIAAGAQYIIPCAMYGRYQIDIYWYTDLASVTALSWNIYGKYNNEAWGVLGAQPPGLLQNTKFQTIAGVAFGAPPVAGGAAFATRQVLCARMQDPDGFDSLCIEMTAINNDANHVIVVGNYRLQGGTT